MAHYFEFVDKDATITRGQEADSTGKIWEQTKF